MPRKYTHKVTLDTKYWNAQLKRIGKQLSSDAHRLFRKVANEMQQNHLIKKIYDRARSEGLYIPSLTEKDGNCLFESLELNGFSENKTNLRRSVALLFFLFGDTKNAIFSYNDTLKKTFNETTAVVCPYVYSHKEKKL